MGHIHVPWRPQSKSSMLLRASLWSKLSVGFGRLGLEWQVRLGGGGRRVTVHRLDEQRVGARSALDDILFRDPAEEILQIVHGNEGSKRWHSQEIDV